MRKHVYMRPPATVPTEMTNASPDNQAPIIPPTVMLTSNQKIQIASLKAGSKVRARGTIVTSVEIVQRDIGVSAGANYG
jgi:hypothetical protein